MTATDGHPFWVPELGEWIDVTDLQPGQWLQTGAGTYVQITAVERWTVQRATVHNLVVGNTHTYYVVAGSAPVLVHNCQGGFKHGISAEEIDELNRSFGGERYQCGTAENALINASRYNSFWEKSAVLIRDIAGSHLYNNGNKRTAYAVVSELMRRNNIMSGPTSDELWRLIVKVRACLRW